MSEATILAADLMDTRLAACVQISRPGLSVYRWKGKVEQADEYYLSIKAALECGGNVVSWLKQHHPYVLPEIILSECDAIDDYADWVQSNTPEP